MTPTPIPIHLVAPTPIPVHIALPTTLPVHVADPVSVWLVYVLPLVSAIAAVLAGYYAVRTGHAALRALRRPRLLLRPSYRSANGNYQVELTEDGNAAITFDLDNDESNQATNVKVNIRVPGFVDAGLEGEYYIRLHLDGSGTVKAGVVSPGDSYAVGAIVAKAPPGRYTAQWYIISNEGRWPQSGWHSEDFEVISNRRI